VVRAAPSGPLSRLKEAARDNLARRRRDARAEPAIQAAREINRFLDEANEIHAATDGLEVVALEQQRDGSRPGEPSWNPARTLRRLRTSQSLPRAWPLRRGRMPGA